MASDSKCVDVEAWGRKPGVYLYTLRNGGITARITNWGATIVSLCLRDPSAGEDIDIVLGFDSCDPYMDGTSPYFGCIVGRVANRIKDASFSMDGVTYTLPANNNMNTLHGGEVGYDKVLWQSQIVKESQVPVVEFTYHSSDGEQGFPGELDVSVTYALHENELRVEMRAVPASKQTPVSLAQHTYWNLAGHKSGSILDHTICISASRYTPVDDFQIPTGELAPVAGTAFDFLQEARIGSRIDQVEGGYDHNYVLDQKQGPGLCFAARVRDPSSGRTMELLTDAPGLQFYTGNFLVAEAGKDGEVYRKHAGLCLETQGFPNAVNDARFPSVMVSPGEVYRHQMVFRFSVTQKEKTKCLLE
ncbi:hypothetical protein SELMODRAFT_159754 [Selaginella moellendorffii]|uniref:Aldose 1-epimerase n=1 Tax=Selaginella moellendorffii TaxID=88036 RepID=D8SZU0_SELML|nr:aldose 1-epimerase [Selaginella moellendorffii]EFJ10082.1 hypothetical protein SELMODRAFT_159754 [Selaginella moellendorffii]|eukprot:XP_002988820.1 aldose 1-epimerase [Selaginella moellendorffii]